MRNKTLRLIQYFRNSDAATLRLATSPSNVCSVRILLSKSLYYHALMPRRSRNHTRVPGVPSTLSADFTNLNRVHQDRLELARSTGRQRSVRGRKSTPCRGLQGWWVTARGPTQWQPGARLRRGRLLSERDPRGRHPWREVRTAQRRWRRLVQMSAVAVTEAQVPDDSFLLKLCQDLDESPRCVRGL
ncbi:hypothetical protein ABIB56_000625 [Glaciihabitans sp. UYNi722]